MGGKALYKVLEAYLLVLHLGGPEWAAASHYRQGAALEQLSDLRAQAIGMYQRAVKAAPDSDWGRAAKDALDRLGAPP